MRMSSPIGHAKTELPAVDERLVAPESGYEIDDGKLVRVSPSDPPHAIRHSKIAAMLEAHAADDFEVAVDLLTRVSETSDRAPDASVFPREPDPETGGRQLEHLAFEIVSTESLGHAAKKASDLATRGVRRIFAVDVDRIRAFEWSATLATWNPLDPSSSIVDRCLAVPLRIGDLLRAAKTDDSVARALLAKRNPVLVAEVAKGEARGRAEGEARGRADAILLVLSRRGLVVTETERQRIACERDIAQLDRWLAQALTCTSVTELLEREQS